LADKQISPHDANLVAVCMGVAAKTLLDGFDGNGKAAAAEIRRIASVVARMVAEGKALVQPDN
jgi:hypothetical protein